MSDCQHTNVLTTCGLARFDDCGPDAMRLADITINCTDCGACFEWCGNLPMGLDAAKGTPRTNIERTELRIGVRIQKTPPKH